MSAENNQYTSDNAADEYHQSPDLGENFNRTRVVYSWFLCRNFSDAVSLALQARSICNSALRLVYPFVLFALTAAVIYGFLRRQKHIARRYAYNLSCSVQHRCSYERTLFMFMVAVVLLAFVQVLSSECRRLIEILYPPGNVQSNKVSDNRLPLPERLRLFKILLYGYQVSRMISNLCTAVNHSFVCYLYVAMNRLFRNELVALLLCRARRFAAGGAGLAGDPTVTHGASGPSLPLRARLAAGYGGRLRAGSAPNPSVAAPLLSGAAAPPLKARSCAETPTVGAAAVDAAAAQRRPAAKRRRILAPPTPDVATVDGSTPRRSKYRWKKNNSGSIRKIGTVGSKRNDEIVDCENYNYDNDDDDGGGDQNDGNRKRTSDDDGGGGGVGIRVCNVSTVGSKRNDGVVDDENDNNDDYDDGEDKNDGNTKRTRDGGGGSGSFFGRLRIKDSRKGKKKKNNNYNGDSDRAKEKKTEMKTTTKNVCEGENDEGLEEMEEKKEHIKKNNKSWRKSIIFRTRRKTTSPDNGDLATSAV